MSDFLRATKSMIQRHGVNVTFKRVSVPTYNAYSGATTSTTADIAIKAYPRQIVATQYNLPNMIGKEVIEFYIYAPDISTVPPKANDKIVMNTVEYIVNSMQEHRALGTVVLYKVIAVKP